MIVEIGKQETESLIAEKNFGHLGCVLETGEPYIVPVNYLFKDNCFYIHSAPGLKINSLRANTKACMQVDEITQSFEWRSAVAQGEFEEIKDEAEKHEVIQELAGKLKELTPVEAIHHAEGIPIDVILFRIRINKLSGRAEK